MSTGGAEDSPGPEAGGQRRLDARRRRISTAA
jgi:hypothetical protein